MKVLILNQAFYPDVVSTAQHATDLAIALTSAGHEVTVICSRRAYDDPSLVFPRDETWMGIRIKRVPSTSFGKGAKWRRAVDFASFLVTCTFRLLFLEHVDVIVCLTSPPLISYIGSLAVPLKARRMVFWCMDLNPDEAIAAGWLRKNSWITRFLSRLMLHSLDKADRIIALDRFMKARIQAKGIDESKIIVIPPWSHDQHVKFDPAGRDKFRVLHGMREKFVVMYSGNHSPCHPLATLLQSAEQLAAREDIMFCLIGGGSEFRRVRQDLEQRGVHNVLCLPYQPIEKLSASLSAADLHVVVMGDPFVGIVHPCKVYNILAVGRPFLYIGPSESHVEDILAKNPGLGYAHRHGQIDQVVATITAACNRKYSRPAPAMSRQFASDTLVPEMVRAIEELSAEPQSRKKPQAREQLSPGEKSATAR